MIPAILPGQTLATAPTPAWASAWSASFGATAGSASLGLSLNCFERAGAGDLDLDGDLETGRPFDPERD